MPSNSPIRNQMPDLQDFPAFIPQAPSAHRIHEVPVFLLEAGQQDVLRIELDFSCGSWDETYQHSASLTNRMLQEGSQHRSGAALAEFFDFYGAYLQYETTADRSSIALYCLSHQAAVLMPILIELVFSPAFPEKELATTLQNMRQQLLIEADKVAYLARTGLMSGVFGANHPYGRSSSDASLAAVNVEQLRAFHQQHYVREKLSIVVCGKQTAQILPLFEQLLVDIPAQNNTSQAPIHQIQQQKGLIHLPKEGALQYAIRLGKATIDKRHPDYHGLKVLNTVLGGYFGSRLMRNIREDKGFTYGIGSAVVSYRHAALFTLATEVGKDVAEAALLEIQKEIKLLSKEKIKEEELDKVRRYLNGIYLSSFDGAFALADRFRDLYHFGLDYSFYENYLHTVNHIQLETLQTLAQKYLDADSMLTVIAGGESWTT